ncbi:stonustoxin subunit alpha [Caerostris darwini]|uniref:Stonustoxin subunit alpha n=1 Tax=Caerostris darwini TaxID=1538125 RepID=A0AAV4Q9J3_9ARAC|nr:stonustoxin subunit alpha [Caerostris darwini]
MGTVVMMYVLPMMLGQTYDLGKEKPGLQIYPKSVEQDAVTVQHYYTDSQYRMVENSAEIKDFLSISGKLSLKIKAGMVDVSGEGSYLKDSSSKTNGMEILVKAHFETVTKTIPTSLKPNADWSLINDNFLGTHYCRSIIYGGDLVASIRISATNTYDLMKIKAAINGGINVGGGSFKGNIQGKLEMLKENAQDASSMEIKYYASVPLNGVTYDVEGLLKLIDEFPDHVRKVNNGTGNPLRMELYPVSSLKEGWPAYLENRAIGDELDDLEAQFDDLRETRRLLGAWAAALPPVAPSGVDEKIQKFTDKVNNIFGTYLKTIADLDVSKGASSQPIKDAFAAYEDGEYIMPKKYVRKLTELENEIYAEHPELAPRIGGAQYIRWGQSNCSTPETGATVVGVSSTSEIVQDGGSSQFLCSSLDPSVVDPTDYFNNYPGDDDPDSHLLVSPLRYVGELQRYKSMYMKQIACVRCRAPIRTTMLMKVADKVCPSDKWTKEYEGYLMAPGQKSNKGEYICMDKDMKEPQGEVKFGNSDTNHLPEIQEVSIECGSLPCTPYVKDRPIPCVVCTI